MSIELSNSIQWIMILALCVLAYYQQKQITKLREDKAYSHQQIKSLWDFTTNFHQVTMRLFCEIKGLDFDELSKEFEEEQKAKS